jgi:subtilisin family serine protease
LNHVVNVGQAQVVNVSLGIFAGTVLPELRKALNHAYDQGVIVVCAAGNFVDPVVAPARLSRTVGVAGVTRELRPWSGSSFGPEVDFSGPAADLRRADVTPQFKYGYGGGGDGTSYATAITTGAAALWLTQRRQELLAAYDQPWCTVEAFTLLARQTARIPPNVGWIPGAGFGTGVLDIGALLAAPLPLQSALTQAPAA